MRKRAMKTNYLRKSLITDKTLTAILTRAFDQATTHCLIVGFWFVRVELEFIVTDLK